MESQRQFEAHSLVFGDLQKEVIPGMQKLFESKINKIERNCCIVTLDQFLCANKGNFMVQSAANFTLPGAKETEINWSRKGSTNYSALV